MNPMAARATWKIVNVRAKDLAADDVAMIEGEWRYVFDVWRHGDDVEGQFPTDSMGVRIRKILDSTRPDMWIIVRYMVEETSTDRETDDDLKEFRSVDLVQVQRRAQS